MDAPDQLLHVVLAGPASVVSFGGRELLDDANVAVCREQLLELIDREDCQTLAIDLSGVRLVPSGLLGLLATVRRRGVDLHLYNPSPDVREVLAITNLDNIMSIHELPPEQIAGRYAS